MSYIFFNPNPRNKYVGNCVVRAMSPVMTEATMGVMNVEEAITMEEATKEIIPEKEVIVDTNIQTLTALNT